MTEATGGGDGRGEMEQKLRRLSMEDDSFRQALLADPKAVIEEKLGARLPAEGEVRVVEETADTIYVVLPPRATGTPDGELSDGDLDAVAGGGWPLSWSTCATCGSCA